MKKAIIFVSLILIICIAMLVWVRQENLKSREVAGEKLENTGDVKITFLDIGQGDASFINFPDGQQMLVDCSEDGRILEALGRVMPYYDKTIDYLLVTHPDLDHYGGCQEVLNRFEVKNIITNGLRKENNPTWLSFWEAAQVEGAQVVEIENNKVWEISSTTLHFLYPDHSILDDPKIPGFDKEVNGNNTSVVFRLEYAENSVLFTGDAEEELEEYLLELYDGDQLDVDILKAGHHGSDSSSSQEFLEMTTPEHTIISAGEGNKFGHPSRRILKRLERVGSEIWRTDLQGDICLLLGSDGLRSCD